MKTKIQELFNSWQKNNENFSGVFSVTAFDKIINQQACGYRNKAESLPNKVDTAFAIASGTKLFTGLAICQLIDNKKISLQDKLWDILPYDLGQIDKNVTVFHLLTHTSGIGDYIDEESDDYGSEQLNALNKKYPCYLWDNLKYYLQMITPLNPKFEPGHRFAYSNAGFVMLGLVVEAASKIPYQQYVQKNIIAPCKLSHTGFYRMDTLPANTAYGYINEWQTNIFNMPVIGGSDGGLFTCAEDLDKLWRAIFSNKLLSEDMTQQFLKPQIERRNNNSYGLGVYLRNKGEDAVYYAVGGDSGVDFFTAYFPKTQTVASALGNTEINTFPLFENLFDLLS